MSTDPGAGGGPPSQLQHLSEDEQTLHRLGYAQELLRGWGGFSNFAISFTIISILAGCLTSYYIAIVWGGPVAVTWGWLLVGGFCILVSLAMGEIASTYPTAGGLYYWSSRLGSPGWGWFTGWFNFLGQVAVTAAIDFGAATFISSLLNLWFSMSLSKEHVFIVYSVIIVLHGLINTFGVRLLAMINNISAWWHMGGVLVIVLVLIFIPDHHKSLSFVFTDTENFSGFQGHSFANPVFWFVFGIGLLDVPVHDHRLRRLGAHERGDAQRVAIGRDRHGDVGRRVGDLRVHPARRRHVRDPGPGGQHRRAVRLCGAVHLAERDEQQVGRVPARDRLRGAVLLRPRVGDVGIADDVRLQP